MGTRSLTVFRESDGTEIVVMYRQMDGYPDGHGQELAEFLKDFRITNGLSGEATKHRVANGMDCLAAQVVARFKHDVQHKRQERDFEYKDSWGEAGSIYLHPAGTRDAGEEYIYTVSHRAAYPKDQLPEAPAKDADAEVWRQFHAECEEKKSHVPTLKVEAVKNKDEHITIFDGLASNWDTEVVMAAKDAAWAKLYPEHAED
jgi:hypothetical protein